ncbi:cystinosin-like [Pelomyxa schiedti]|nr:cystinosin-like [Pelomyxa schiedti]
MLSLQLYFLNNHTVSLGATTNCNVTIPLVGAMSWTVTNCLSTLPEAFCYVGNVAGYCSTVIWLLVLLPQLYKNWKRKSTAGLSPWWATANFTASLCNIFFVFRNDLPLYSKISAVYFVVIEACLLLQFLWYWKARVSLRAALACGGAIASFSVLLVEGLVPSVTNPFQWISTVLWATELFPQLYLNFLLESTDGQSAVSITITLIGKTTDFISGYFLDMPPQVLVMTFFSSSTAFTNVIQAIYYNSKWFAKPAPPVPGSSASTSALTQHQHAKFLFGKAPSAVLILAVASGLIVFLVGLEWRLKGQILAILCPPALWIAIGACYLATCDLTNPHKDSGKDSGTAFSSKW